MKSEAMPPTPLGALYDALCALKEQERTALAEAHAEDPRNLRDRFVASVEAVAERPPTVERFHDSRRKAPPFPPTPPAKLTRTIEFPSHLCDGRPRAVRGGAALRFRYVDREIFPARTKGGTRAAPRRLDLLLVNDIDSTPIFGELKIGSDKDAYFALVQALMHAAEFQSASQLARLRSRFSDASFVWPDDGPFADIYVIAFKSPYRGKYRKRLLDASEKISEHLVEHEAFSRYIRRIAYIDALGDEGTLAFRQRFAVSGNA